MYHAFLFSDLLATVLFAIYPIFFVRISQGGNITRRCILHFLWLDRRLWRWWLVRERDDHHLGIGTGVLVLGLGRLTSVDSLLSVGRKCLPAACPRQRNSGMNETQSMIQLLLARFVNRARLMGNFYLEEICMFIRSPICPPKVSLLMSRQFSQCQFY